MVLGIGGVKVDSLQRARSTPQAARVSGIPETAMMHALFVEAIPLLAAEHGPEQAARFLVRMADLI